MFFNYEKRHAARFNTNYIVLMQNGLGLAHNFSHNGIFILTSQQYQAESLIEFTIIMERLELGLNRLLCRGRVTRIEQQKKYRGFAAQIEDYKFVYSE